MIRGTVSPDSTALNIEFDITPWLVSADTWEVVELINNTSKEVRDSTVYYLEPEISSLKDMLTYIRIHNNYTYEEPIGFSVSINTAQATAWVKENRPEVYKLLEEEE